MLSSLWTSLNVLLAFLCLAGSQALAGGVPANACIEWAGPARVRHHHPNRILIDYDEPGTHLKLAEKFGVNYKVTGLGTHDRTVTITLNNLTNGPRNVIVGMLKELENGTAPPAQHIIDGQIPFRTIEQVVHSQFSRAPHEVTFCIHIDRNDLASHKALSLNFFD